jgi:hypothetical protein
MLRHTPIKYFEIIVCTVLEHLVIYKKTNFLILKPISEPKDLTSKKNLVS